MQLFKILEQTLEMGENSITFIDNSINDDCIIEIYTDNTNVAPLSATQDGHTVTIIFELQPVDVNVKLCINNIVEDFGNYDGLDSYSTTSSLSANQGRILKELIDESGESAKIDYGTTEEFDEVKDILEVGTSYYITDDYDEISNTYSYEETRVGTFLGKPLYRKVIPTGRTSISTSTFTLDIGYETNNIHALVDAKLLKFKRDAEVHIVTGVGIWHGANSGDSISIKSFQASDNFENDYIFLILDYTKVGD